MSIGTVDQLAVDYLLRARDGDDHATAERIESQLAALPSPALAAALCDDGARLAFWIDLYNASVLRQPDLQLALGSWRARATLFGRTAIVVAGTPLSLDDIEHGLLRRSRWKLSLGLGSNPRPSAFERIHRVARLDPRIHFALNCAASSCPPIAPYRSTGIDERLDMTTRSFLAVNVRVEPGRITVPRVFLWFAGDFGGAPGIRDFLRRHGVRGAGRPLRFAAWDWTPAPGRWAPDASEPSPTSEP